MIKIAHEAPKSIFEDVQKVTDYDYALVHLLEEDEEYLTMFEKAIKKGREVILDNSIFELEEAFEADRFALWVERLKPTWYIVPDALENAEKTMKQMADWFKNYSDVPGKSIGVVQGKTYREIKECYRAIDELSPCDMIAISFDYSYYRESVPHPNKYVSWMLGRVKLLGDLERDGIINKDKPHHLLGASLATEFKWYVDNNIYNIRSLDTSNPVVAGLLGYTYNGDFGLDHKPSQLLADLIGAQPDEDAVERIMYNTSQFKRIIKRRYW